jgi:hypothetical protein
LANKLNRRSQQRLKRIVDSLENISKFVNKLNMGEIEDLIRRDAIVVDGPSSAPSSSFAVGRSGGSSSSSPVERAVIARVEGRQQRDPVRETVKSIERKIISAEESLRQIHVSIEMLNMDVEKKKSRKASEPCEICLILPAVKTAMCITCYTEWVEVGAPDRFRWRAYKRQITNSEGIPLVTEQPAPRREH